MNRSFGNVLNVAGRVLRGKILPDQIGTIRFRMEQAGLSEASCWKYWRTIIVRFQSLGTSLYNNDDCSAGVV
jgi:hypothetical protein